MSNRRILVLHAFAESPTVITAALRVARNAALALPQDQVQVVVQGTAVTGMTVEGGYDDDLAQTIAVGVQVVACGNSMKRADVDPEQLAPGVGMVPSAVVHLAQQQWAGAAYVRT